MKVVLCEKELTSQLLETLRQGEITKILRKTGGKNIEIRREVGNNSFFADILISAFSKKTAGNNFDNKYTKFIAIEVKISDWRQGLYQAWRYSSFAEKSYLALYKEYSKNIDIGLFKEYNVGLIIFDERTIQVLHNPEQISFSDENTYMIQLREKIWQRSLSIQSIQPAV